LHGLPEGYGGGKAESTTGKIVRSRETCVSATPFSSIATASVTGGAIESSFCSSNLNYEDIPWITISRLLVAPRIVFSIS
jgi:hypothetical protein